MRTLKRLATVAVSVASAGLILAACSSSGSNNAGTSGGTGATGAVKGGTLTVVGSGDVDYFDTAAGYYDATYLVFRAISRQLYQIKSTPLTADQVAPVPDLATGLPTMSNGGKTYTIHIRQGAMWNSTPPRQVTAADEVLGIKRLCNPAAPSGAINYYDNTIVGMSDFCNGFGAVDPTSVPAMKAYIQGHDIPGVKAVDQTTVQFTLTQPAPDFINILAMTFSSPAPVEDLNYIPASTDLANHWVSDGPYGVESYTPTKSIMLTRNSSWKASTDNLRKAYVDKIDIQEGVATSPTAAVQQIQAGTADLEFDQNVPTSQLASMVAAKDPNLVIGPQGDNFLSLNPELVINHQSPNNNGALQKLEVRQAIEYAINKTADSQLYGGATISKPVNQASPPGNAGYVQGYNPYPTPGNNGDPAKAKELLAKAGYQPGQITLKLPYRTTTVHPQIAQTDQAALQAAGFNVQIFPVTPSNTFYTKYIENPDASKSGAWDIAEAGWNPDWLGNNGRSLVQVLYDGRTYGKNTVNYGDYSSPITNSLIDKALAATSNSQALNYWQQAAKQVMADAAIVPIGAQKIALYKSSRVQNCIFNYWVYNCDPTQVWLKR